MTATSTITDVRLTPILISDAPLLNVAGVHAPYAPRLIVEIVTSRGTVGIGETYGDAEYLGIAENLAKAVIGRSLTLVNGLPAVARESNHDLPTEFPDAPDTSGFRGSLTADKLRLSVVSAFEVASLDALGKELELPVHALLGGKVRDAVEYAGYLFWKWGEHPAPHTPIDDWGETLTPEDVVAQARLFAQRCGSRSFKLKGGAFPPEQEVSAILALRDAFPDAPLRLDPNGAWSLDTAVAVAEQLSGIVEYLEDPTVTVDGMAEVHHRTGVPLATNMIVTSTSEIQEAFHKNAVQVVLSDHHYWGGLLATQHLNATCHAWGKRLSMHSNTHLGVSLAAMTQVAATLPELTLACDTHYPWQAEDVLTERLVFENGCLEVSDAPGLGVELDRHSLSRLHRRWLEKPEYRTRDDIGAMRVRHPDHRRPPFPKY